MKIFSETKEDRSAGYARNRMKQLVEAERLACSPHIVSLMKKDLVHTVKKYIKVNEENIRIGISGEPPVLHAEFPIARSKRNER